MREVLAKSNLWHLAYSPDGVAGRGLQTTDSSCNTTEGSSNKKSRKMAATHDIPTVLEAALASNFLSSATNDDDDGGDSWAHFYDLAALDTTLESLSSSFPSHFLHTFAVKSNPLASTMKIIASHNVGMECASFNEVLHSINAGCPNSNVVFDSPCKTLKELRQSLELGILINCDNFDELERVAFLIERGSYDAIQVGLRINPLLGLGTIEALSVSTTDSKFGIPLNNENRQRVLDNFQMYDWLTGLHSHGKYDCLCLLRHLLNSHHHHHSPLSSSQLEARAAGYPCLQLVCNV